MIKKLTLCGLASEVAGVALAFCLPVRGALSRKKPKQFRKEALRINSKLCHLRICQHPYKLNRFGRLSYVFVQVYKTSIQKYDFLIILQRVSGYPEKSFVIPVKDILGHWNGGFYKQICIPVEKLPAYNNSHSQVDYWQYENAWHLLMRGSM